MSTYESKLSDISKSLPRIELTLQAQHERLCKMLATGQPCNVIKQIANENDSFSEKVNEIRLKQENCIKAHLANLQEISENLRVISTLCADGNQNSLQCSELELKQDVQSLNRKCLEQSLENDIYNPETLQALSTIRDELIRTLEEQSDLKAILSSRLARYESDPNLMKILNAYTETLSKIQSKQRDIASLNS